MAGEMDLSDNLPIIGNGEFEWDGMGWIIWPEHDNVLREWTDNLVFPKIAMLPSALMYLI